MRSVLLFLAVTGMFAVAGCGDSQQEKSEENARGSTEQEQPRAEATGAPVYGQDSFILCTKFADGPVGYGRGSYTVMGKQMAQGAVIVVAAKEGLEIRWKKYPYRSVVLIDEKDGVPVTRVATPSDQVVLNDAVEIFGKSYPKGRLAVPDDGMLPEE